MKEFTTEWIAGAREVVGNDAASTSGQIAFITLDHIERLQARVQELEAEREQTCEWKQETSIYDNEKFYTSPHNQYDNVCGEYQMRKNVYCHTCGKRVKSVDE